MVSGKYDQIKLLFLAQVILVTKSENLALHSICRRAYAVFAPHHTLDKIMAKLAPIKNDLKA